MWSYLSITVLVVFVVVAVLVAWAICHPKQVARMLGIIKFLLVICFMIVPAIADEGSTTREDPPLEDLPAIDGVDPPHPLAPPDVMPKAAAMITNAIESYRDGWGEEMAVRAGWDDYLHNNSTGLYTVNLSNTTGFFTA